MSFARTAAILLLCSAAAVRAQQLQPLIDRPLTLPQGHLDATFHATYTNWATGAPNPSSIDGETLAAGFDFGVTDQVQFGISTALPVNPGAGFGSVLGTIAVALGPDAALRADVGFEQIGLNGATGAAIGSTHINRFLTGIGAPIRIPLAPNFAFVSGRTSSVQFGHFNNIGDSGTGFYSGASAFPDLSSDFFVVSTGSENSNQIIGLNVPAGLLMQPDPHVAFTVRTGYSAVISIPQGANASTQSVHFIPVGLEAVYTPVPALDIGADFFLDGMVGHSGTMASSGYFDRRALMLWLRLRA
jgi:hypothetical protein